MNCIINAQKATSRADKKIPTQTVFRALKAVPGISDIKYILDSRKALITLLKLSKVIFIFSLFISKFTQNTATNEPKTSNNGNLLKSPLFL